MTTSEGGFNPTYQRHVAAYALSRQFLVPGRMIDLGCGIGHSRHLLGSFSVLGVDIDRGALLRHGGPAVVADMRALPVRNGVIASVIGIQSIEHVPDSDRVLSEVTRVLEPDGVGIFVTPNRLTFGHSGEVVDPYHFREYDPAEFRALVAPYFEESMILGLFGSLRYMKIYDGERRWLSRVLRADVLRLRNVAPRRYRQRLYDLALSVARHRGQREVGVIDPSDFELREGPLETSLDLVAVCRGPSHDPSRRSAA